MSGIIDNDGNMKGLSKKQLRAMKNEEKARRAKYAEELSKLEGDTSNQLSANDEDKDNDLSGDSGSESDASEEVTNDKINKMKILGTADYVVDFRDVIPQVQKMDFKVIQVDMKALAKLLEKFVSIGSLIHKLTPDDLTIVANLEGNYPNKEITNVDTVYNEKVPNTLDGLLANGTKFFDAAVYLGMDPTRRPKPIITQFEKLSGDIIEVPTYDDMAKLTTYLFVVFFFIIIRAHAPSESSAYAHQPMPKFITTVMGCNSSISEIVSYLASFDLIKLSPEWVKFMPMKTISQEALNRMGLGVAGYRLVSVFNVIKSDLYEEAIDDGKGTTITKEPFKKKIKPAYLDVAITVMRSFKLAGYCWDFHPATRAPDLIAKYGNINKNATNLLLEAYQTKTLEHLVKIRKLAIMPVFDPTHVEYQSYKSDMKYVARSRIFGRD